MPEWASHISWLKRCGLEDVSEEKFNQLEKAKTIEIQSINIRQLKQIFSTDTDYDSKIQKKAKNILSTQTHSLIIAVIVGFFGNIVALFIWDNVEKIIDPGTIWGTIRAIPK